ncbi:MAG TPA: class I SAM-dependent methyltransferase [Candidatus Saccharimonadales bacterium]|nr:class I SAM-dependent methyltransferase [Candidatus Saccharimonadales bacterium]
MAAGFERQVRAREEYQRRNPSWVDSVSRYRELIAGVSSRGARILDLGCGRNGLHGDDLSCAAGASVFGVDPDPEALAENGVISPRVVGSGEDLPFGTGTFDVVASAWVLEHLDHPGLVFSEVRRVLVSGGSFVFLTPNAWNYNAWMIRAIPHRWHAGLTRRLYGRGEGDAYPVRYRANTGALLHRLLNAAGFESTHLLYNGDPSYIAFNRPLLEAAFGIERVLARPGMRGAQVHILGVARA